MGAEVFPGISFQCLAPPGDAEGVSCDEDGPSIGAIRLLNKTASDFTPRPVEELNKIFGYIFECPVDCSDLVERLNDVATALNIGALVRATFATLFMHLPSLSKEQGLRAIQARKLFKASPDDPRHPGWPKGTEGGKGGQFKPKDGAAAEASATDKVARIAVRRLIRGTLVQLLVRHSVRLAVEAGGDAIPGLNIAASAATVAELAAMALEFAALTRDADAAIDLVQKGPYSLDQLRVSPDDVAFSSFGEFKKIDFDKRFGPAGDGYDYHHIVEQSANGEIPKRELQSTQNIIRIPRLLHEEISAQYSRWKRNYDGSLRERLDGASFDDRWNAGLQVMRDIGILKGE